ncbi:MAG TPA: nitroreductase [Xanthomonadaceae bacterium]|nr:nitroreductase [Xanthomonadaceae bacterium]
MNPFATLLDRHSTPSRQLGEPGPDPGQLLRMLEVAVHVPDHGRLAPWRFVRIAGAARAALGEALALRLVEREPDASEARVSKERERFNHAPCVILVVSRPTRDHKAPESEQIQSGSCVCFALLQAADALGLGAQWLTGWAAYDEQILRLLGVSAHERVLGFIHIGSAISPQPDRDRPDAASLLTDWLPA